MNYLSAEEKTALRYLSCRTDSVIVNKNIRAWGGFVEGKGMICFICGNSILLYSAEGLSKHGRQHLKEHNLLIFI